jgi:hypothetical protein
MSATDTQTAVAARAAAPRLRDHFALSALQAQLPLRFPGSSVPEVPATFRTLSWYTYSGWKGLAQADTLVTEQGLYLALHLIDFSALRDELVQLTGIHVNARGQTPFDPVSLFLCCLLYWETQWGWTQLAQALQGSWGDRWRPLLGFTADATPGASTMRTFYHALGEAFGTSLGPRFMQLLADAELLPPHDPDSPVPARDGLPLATDGQLHEAHTSERCAQVTASCYQPLLPGQSRPCPARDTGYDGCACDTDACTRACRYTTPRDAEARHIHYSGHNQDDETDKQGGRDVYGYRSYAHTLVDDDLHTYWVAYTSVHPATTDERVIFPHDFAQLQAQLPQLPISELVADAALGYTPCLDVIYDAQAIPIVYIRHAPSDSDADACQLRGYDRRGRPLCPHGHPLAFNGLDYARLRAGWVCHQVCTRTSSSAERDCPFRDSEHPLGLIKHVQRAFTHPDGSHHARLARLFPLDAPSWKTRYGSRRNATESRNSQLKHLGLARIRSYGLDGARDDIIFADLLINLRNLVRLVQQATAPIA